MDSVKMGYDIYLTMYNREFSHSKCLILPIEYFKHLNKSMYLYNYRYVGLF